MNQILNIFLIGIMFTSFHLIFLHNYMEFNPYIGNYNNDNEKKLICNDICDCKCENSKLLFEIIDCNELKLNKLEKKTFGMIGIKKKRKRINK